MKQLSHKQCNVCALGLGDPIYNSKSEQSLTSLCQLYPGSTQVWYCSNCGHLQSKQLENNDVFYANDYKILINHEDEDQIYEAKGDEIIYRTDHQLKTLQEKLTINPNIKALDYGCAKAEMAKRLKAVEPTIDYHLFDVSDMYSNYWEKITTMEKCAVNFTPNHWLGTFDLVTSFFSFEHIPNPQNSISHVASLLKENGLFYAVVPDVLTNIADFVVVDHVNHFTIPSFTKLLLQAGFSNVDIDDGVHRGALVITAQKKSHGVDTDTISNKSDTSVINGLSNLRDQVNQVADFWDKISVKIIEAEKKTSKRSAIYGSGFYGSLIYSYLDNPEAVECFLDQSPFQQNQTLFGTPIISPQLLPDYIKTLYIGLNPKIACDIISSQEKFKRTDLNLVFLGEVDD